jgi:5-methylthioribose kinase
MLADDAPARKISCFLVELTPSNAAHYLGQPCRIQELGGGVSNTVLLAECPAERIVLKQSLGKLRVEQDWRSERSRIFRETAAMRMLGSLLPRGSVPSVLREDRENYILVMSAAPAEASMWKTLLFDGALSDSTAARIGTILGTIIARTWKSAVCEATFGDQTVFDQLRIDPYYRFTALRHPDLAKQFENLIATSSQRRVSLVHGDWSPKNFLIDGDKVMVIDFEVIHYGDPAFDAAFLLNHLLLKSYRLPQWRDGFHSLAREFWRTLTTLVPNECDWFEQATIEHLGCLLLARIDGKSPVEYIRREELKEFVRQTARRMITAPPRTIAEVFAC